MERLVWNGWPVCVWPIAPHVLWADIPPAIDAVFQNCHIDGWKNGVMYILNQGIGWHMECKPTFSAFIRSADNHDLASRVVEQGGRVQPAGESFLGYHM